MRSILRHEMNKLLPQDQPQTGKRVKDKELRKQYAQCVIKIRDMEKRAANLFEKM